MWGDPKRKINFIIQSPNTRYEYRVDNKKTYRLDQVLIIENDNSRRTYTEADSGDDPSEDDQTYTWDSEFNTLTFSAATISAWDGNMVIINYVPNEFHHLVRLKAALSILDATVITNTTEDTPALAIRFMTRIKRLENASAAPVAIGSTNERFYDPTLGENVPQRRFVTY